MTHWLPTALASSMQQPKPHILLCGPRRSGKSWLIRQLLEQNTRPLKGLYTRRLPEADHEGYYPIYLHLVGAEPWQYTEANCIGWCNGQQRRIYGQVFDRLGIACLQAGPGERIVIDELGFFEAQSPAYTAAVLQALDGDVPVLAAVRARWDVPFLQQVRSHGRVQVFDLTEQSPQQLLPLLQEQIRLQNRLEYQK